MSSKITCLSCGNSATNIGSLIHAEGCRQTGYSNEGDCVNHPSHYTTGRIEVIDFIEDQQLGFHEGNVVKYVARARHKGNELQDLEKALWYLQRRVLQLSIDIPMKGTTE